MTKNEVKKALREIILKGYRPYYDLESAEDHGINWLLLTKEEFNLIYKKTIAEIEQKEIVLPP